MDLLFKRYASPFILLDNLIQNNGLFDFIGSLIDTYNDERLYEIWLHKCFDKSFEDYKQACTVKQADESEIKETIKNSEQILNKFVPEN